MLRLELDRGPKRSRASKLGGWRSTCASLLLGAATIAPAQTFNTLASFDQRNGANPTDSLVQGTDGSFYGTTNVAGYNGGGTVFKITPDGNLSTLYNFCARANCADGSWPGAGLILATDGIFYGTTHDGGAYGFGTVFKITSGDTLTTLHSFNFGDGFAPIAGLVQASGREFYGTTIFGGRYGGSDGAGTVFKITPAGELTTLYDFCGLHGCPDGEYPRAALAQATNGSFFGTTIEGGANGGGTVFNVKAGGKLTTLYSFCGQSNCYGGYSPNGLIHARDGNFYSTTQVGGANNDGTVFKITPAGRLTTLYSFCSEKNCADGWSANGLVQGTDGSFYGTTYYGGANNYGSVFKITPGGTLTTLYSFCSQNNCTDGYGPVASLVQGTDGILYGTTYAGGTQGQGTIFSLAVGLGPFVETNPTTGKVGNKVIILGNNLKGTTTVAFNGTAAEFKVISSTEIKTSVPTGATTGYVTVTTPRRKLKSKVVFRVTK
jgi:uncharacterized repeat protein (TIGR03803 family)